MFLSTISFIYYFILLNAKKIPHSVISVVCSKRRARAGKTRHWFLGGGDGVTLGEGVAMSTVEKGAILEKCLNTLSLFVACKDRRHFATLPDWFPSEKTSKERP